MKTILITGCSSGFGLETVRYFLQRDWKVVATMRSPSRSVLEPSPNLRVVPLDVADPDSIDAAAREVGPIDAVVNNAGIGLLSVVEGTPMAALRSIFETNTFGAIAVTQAMLPRLRERRGGVVVNVSSSVTLKALPLVSIYTATKAALNAFTESLALELEPLNIRARVVLPGQALTTPFGQNAMAWMQAQNVTVPSSYAEFSSAVIARITKGELSDLSTHPLDVAKAVWTAVTDPAAPMFLPAGGDAVELARSRSNRLP